MYRHLQLIGALVLALAGWLIATPALAEAQTPAGAPPAAVSTPGVSGGSRLLFGPTGRMLEPGRGYIAMDGLLLATASVGVTPAFSFGAGTLVGWGEGGRPFWIVPKFRLLSRGNTSVALTVVHAVLPDHNRMGLAYLVSTTGTADRSFTIGGAVAYYKDHDDPANDGARPVFVIGGDRRLNPKWTVLTENYLTNEGGVLSVTARRQRGRLTVDLGAFMLFDLGDGAFVLPIVSAAWHF